MTLSNRSFRAPFTALAIAAFLAMGGAVWSAPAQAATCGQVVPYPGDAASSESFANWMANAAWAKKVPAELPIMAGLVESGLKNLNYGDADSLGFFQMRTSVWNNGQYKGYATHPELQLKWFFDQAASVRANYIANKKADPAASESTYGVWIADLESPAAQYRYKYQLRLGEAKKLIKATCPDLEGVNVDAPVSNLTIKHKQHPGRSGAIAVRVSCPEVTCVATGSAVFRLPGRKSVVRLASDTYMIPGKGHVTMKLRIPHSIRKRIRSALTGGATTTARLRISVAGTNGAATVRVRKIALAR